MKNNCGIYKITNLINNKCYIGQSTRLSIRKRGHFRDLENGKHINKHLQRSFNKYGENNFKFEILQYCIPDELDELEKFYISKYNSCDEHFGYNIESGGNKNKVIPESTREILRNKFKGDKNPFYGKHHSEKTRNKIKEYYRLHPFTKEQKENISKKLMGDLKGAVNDYINGMSLQKSKIKNHVNSNTLKNELVRLGIHRGRGRSPEYYKLHPVKHKNNIIKINFKKIIKKPFIIKLKIKKENVTQKQRCLRDGAAERMEIAISLYVNENRTIESISKEVHINEVRLSKELKRRGLHKGWVMIDKTKIGRNNIYKINEAERIEKAIELNSNGTPLYKCCKICNISYIKLASVFKERNIDYKNKIIKKGENTNE